MYKQLCLAVLFAVLSCTYGSAIDTRTETTCQTHKRNSGGNSRTVLMRWDIECDEEGLYKPKQCTVDTPKWCACYNKEEAITSPSRSTKSCTCHLARDAAIKNGASPCDVPTCDRKGDFEKKQCCETTRKCHCVDPATGERKSEPTSNRNIKCN